MTKPVSKLLPPASPITQVTPKSVLSSNPEKDDEREIEIETLRRKYRKTWNPTPIEGIDVGDSEEVLDPQIRIPDQNDFELPPPLQDICRAHQDGGSSQGGTRHSLPPARRRGGFNFNDQLNSSTKR